jgi:Ca2+-binding EF-hand superfamily protein
MIAMFNKYNIRIEEKELNKMFEAVVKSGEKALNFKDFKECAISSDAN